MTKTTIRANSPRSVTLTFLSADTDETVRMQIWAPTPGPSGMSYVRFDSDRQLCAGLSAHGQTLSYHAGTDLVDLVRRQYRAMRATERRNVARRGYP